jgi:hypothetical protein
MMKSNWELARLTDGTFSVRFQGSERWLLAPGTLSRDGALDLAKMMNSLGLSPKRLVATRPGEEDPR